MTDIRTKRLTSGDRDTARKLFLLMAAVFEEDTTELSDIYLDNLLRREDFWAIAAWAGNEIVGGLTAHSIPMTRIEASEIFIYDIAVRADYQRRGIGRRLIANLRQAASVNGAIDVFVPVDNEDTHALDFYRALGGTPAPITIFTFAAEQYPPGGPNENLHRPNQTSHR